MDKETFIIILQCALLNFDGVNEIELIEKGFEINLVKTGISLANYLKGFK